MRACFTFAGHFPHRGCKCCFRFDGYGIVVVVVAIPIQSFQQTLQPNKTQQNTIFD